MVLSRIVTAAAAAALAASPSGARCGDFRIGLGPGDDELRSAADEPAIASARAGPQSTADFHSSPGDGIASMAVRGVAQAAPGSRTGALFRSILVPGYGQLYNGQRLKGSLLFGAEMALLTAALTFHLSGDTYNREARLLLGSDPGGRAQQLYDSAQARYRVRDGLLLAATGMWVLNMADAYLSGGRARPLLAAGAPAPGAPPAGAPPAGAPPAGAPPAGAPAQDGGELAPLAAIRPGQAVFGLQGRF